MLRIIDVAGRSCNHPNFDRSTAVAMLGVVSERVKPR